MATKSISEGTVPRFMVKIVAIISATSSGCTNSSFGASIPSQLEVLMDEGKKPVTLIPRGNSV